jgi:flagellar hook protein FlgE
MSFQTGLAGLNTTTRSLDVIGNNIANANTIGMKSSRAEFSNLIASSMGADGMQTAGLGVNSTTTSQNFAQGSIIATGNDLDIAINGAGFFQLQQPDGSSAYTRDGAFKLDKFGNIVTNSGAKVMGVPTDIKGNPTNTANATTSIAAELNLDARAPLAAGKPAVAAVAAQAGPPAVDAVAAVAAVPPTTRSTYATSINAFDSQGAAVPVNLYFERVASTGTGSAAVDNWNVYDSASSTTPLLTMSFDNTGKLTAPLTSTTITIDTPSATTPSISATLDLSKVTQYGTPYAVTSLTQDGYVSGELVGMKIGDNGIITARYSNGQTQAAGKFTLAEFRNTQGLAPTGGGTWVETYASGTPLTGSPGVGKFGALSSGSLEESNVDLTAELVNMMTAQRAYQANAQTIKTQDQIMTTLVNLR